MKKIAGFLAAAVFCAALNAGAQTNVHSVNIVGYVNEIFQPGYTLFGNPLMAGTNDLNNLFPTAPEDTTISLWDPINRNYSQVSQFSGGVWSTDLTLNPGTGARLDTGMRFTNTFVGTVLAPDGSNAIPDQPQPLPPPFAGPNGIYLLSSKYPVALVDDVTHQLFEYILGRAPNNGEQFSWEDGSEVMHTTTYHTGTGWDNGDPSLNVAQAAFFNIGPIPAPEPSTWAMMTTGLAAALFGARNVRRRAK